jgi:hypothetical protein
VLLTSTTSEFAQAITQSDSSSGFLNRFLPIIVHRLSDLRPRHAKVQGDAIIKLPDDVLAVAGRFAGHTAGPYLRPVMPQVAITLTEDAREHLIAWRHKTVEPKVKSGSITGETWNRAVENVQRVAGLLAMSDAVMEPVVDAAPQQSDPSALHAAQGGHRDVQQAANAQCGLGGVHCTVVHVELAIGILTRGLDNLSELAKSSGQRKSKVELTKDKVLQVLQEAGQDGAALSALGRGPLRSVGKAIERQELLNTMVTDGEIVEIEPTGGTGRSTRRYRLPEVGST